jgi:DNA modification methylase
MQTSIDVWQRYASPVWFDINQTRTLNVRVARSEKDERHLCPLQLDVIERAIELWTLPGEVVFTPFAGIGSELYGAVSRKRKAVGIELKPEYFAQAVKNLRALEVEASRPSLLECCNE